MPKRTNNEFTLGQVIGRERKRKNLSLKELASRTTREDGRAITAQFLHDIEHDRRTPGPAVLRSLAQQLDLDLHFLSALGELPIAEVTAYLRKYPEAAPKLVQAVVTADKAGIIEW